MAGELRSLLPYLREYRWRYVAGIAADLAVDAGNIAMPQFIKSAIDLVASGRAAPMTLLPVLASMLGLAAAIVCGRFLWRYFIHGSSRRIENAMRDRYFAKLMEMPADWYRANKSGDIMARATNDMGAIRQATGMGFITFIDGVFMSTGILAVMFASAPRTAVWTIIPLPFITVLIILFGRMTGGRFKRVQEIFARLAGVAQETVAGIRVVKAFVKEGRFGSIFERSNDDYREASMSLVRVFGFFFPFIAFLSGTTTVILLLAGGSAVVANRMSPGEIVAMLAYLDMLIWPMMGAGFTVNTIQRGAASLKRVNEVLDAKPAIASLPGAFDETPRGDIEFRNLHFSYEGTEASALDGLDLEIPRGATLGILGRVGSGKSTLLKILPRLVDPPAGSVFFGGRDLRDYSLPALRRAFGFVPQESFLFSDTISANLRFGKPELDAERFARVATIAALDDDVAGFPEGWETVVGERGLTLSGGQKQRVAIARALAVDPEILVLDDALSAVDADTEERILAALLEERRGRTNIIVSHRVSTLRHADTIVVLQVGRICQSGTHAELLAEASGFYAEIASLQALEAQLAGAGSEALENA
ncbi:MAG TPA: ABC transporter ATP-binding protein [Rectinemataceae bacterium]|nr:ABC transporter ATP-binding protein [Rectinemataceae bacterium]